VAVLVENTYLTSYFNSKIKQNKWANKIHGVNL
jgi:hypothetical protein